jgi:hypothetical protein
MKKIKSISLTSALLLALAFPALAQYYVKNVDGTYTEVASPIILNTNSTGPFLSGPGMDLLSTLSIATNWGVATFGIMEPASSGHKAAYGVGAVALYNINTYMASGIGIDWLDNQTTMPSGQFQLQLPFLIGGTNGVQATPFAFTGVATPISGGGPGLVGLFGAGLDVKIYGGFGAFYATEKRTGQPALWQLFGVRYSVAL